MGDNIDDHDYSYHHYDYVSDETDDYCLQSTDLQIQYLRYLIPCAVRVVKVLQLV